MAYSHFRMLGVAIAVSGLAIFVGWLDLLGVPAQFGGIVVLMAGGLVFALNGLFAARQTRDLDPIALAAGTVLFGALCRFSAALLLEQPSAADIGPVLWPLLAEGVLGMGLAYLGYYALVARAGAGFASLYAFLVPVLGVIAASAVEGAPITAQHAGGLLTVLAGLLILTQADRIRNMLPTRRPQDYG